MKNIVVIGSGPAGYTAAIYAARADLNPLIIEGKEPGGQLMGTSDIENFPGFKDGILGPQLMADMREQAKKYGTDIQTGWVESISVQADGSHLVHLSNQENIAAKTVIIATGAKARWLNLNKNEERFWGKGYTACATCDGAFFRGRTVAVVGGGDSACEEAQFLTKFADKVYLIHRRNELRASKVMQQRVLEHEKIKVLWNQNVTDLHGENVLESVILTETDTGKESNLSLAGLFMAIGHTPNTAFVKDLIETNQQGYAQTHDMVKTSIPGIYAAGDVADPKYRQAITSAGFGCMAALEAEKYIEQ